MSSLYIGVMSGTSLDGVDIALCDENMKLISFENYPFDDELRSEILHIISNNVHISKIGKIDNWLGEMYAKCINEFLQKNALTSKDIKAIGVHGQTLWHEPKSRFSMQLGNPNRIAYDTNIAVVCDIRRMDMASGGQGAPFAPLFHKVLFGDLGKKSAVVNIGGIANISILDDEIIGYDTGCGNVLMDSWCAQYFGTPYDKDGKIASGGNLNEKLLEELLSDDYFKQDYPKSTGREYFNIGWLKKKLLGYFLFDTKSNEILKEVQHDRQLQLDILRTVTELTAISIVSEAKKFDRELLVLCGGGAKNSFLVERIFSLFAKDVKLTSDYGVREDAIEAMMMSYFAFLRVNKIPLNLKSITGAKENLIAGGLYEPN